MSHHYRVFSLNPTFVEIEIPATQSLLAAARGGDLEAFGEICRPHGTRLLRQAFALCGNLSLAEDLAQDTLVEAWKCLAPYNGRCQFFTWLCAILLNRYRNTLRGNRLLPPPHSAAGTRLNSKGTPAIWPAQPPRPIRRSSGVNKPRW
ncbi:MAG: RNA polymerase sigma factor [Verrucomicrobiota bacterium]